MLTTLDDFARAHESVKLLADLLVALGTIALAIYTGFLARRTRDLAQEGNTAEQNRERQHRQSLAPLCRAETPHFTFRDRGNGTTFVEGQVVKNVGPGPAFDVELSFEMPKQQIVIWDRMGPLGPGDGAQIHRQLPVQAPEDAARTNGVIRITYRDLFGQGYQTIYGNDPFRVTYSGPTPPPTGPGSC